jgi:Raf kinase inhibitor-like YbhB/YbcL family protein
MSLTVTSSQFVDGGTLPNSMVFNGFGHEGENKSPQLSWNGAPPETKSYVITCYDPDAPTTVGFWHWTLFDIPAPVTSLAEGAGAPGAQPHGSILGYTDFGFSGYGGAAPPPGPAHHYIFTVYALDIETVGLNAGSTGALLMFVMNGHILDSGKITGRYGSHQEREHDAVRNEQ